ncbi:MAG: helix-turn-helix domain-containing protein [Solirubrobacterales bacterium]
MASVVGVLVEDVDLAEGLSGSQLREAQRACVARTVRAPRGTWRRATDLSELEQGFGLLVLSGVLSRRVGRDGRFGAELLGPGDLLRPWDDPGVHATMAFTADWVVIKPARFAVLDMQFAARAARYPELAVRLIQRAVLRSRRLATTVAIVQEPKIETRVHMLLWELAERWGRVGAEGVTLSLPMTHALVADMAAASRPAVSAGISSLRKRGRLRRDRDDWILLQGPPAGPR